VVQRDAALGDLARALFNRVSAVDPDELAWRWQPVHRDIYHEQVLVDGDSLAVIDLDDAAMSEPAVDVANVVAHLMLLGAQQGSDVHALQPAIHAFLRRAHARDPGLEPTLVAFLVATTLVRLSGIHIGRERGVAIAHDLLHAANRYIPCTPSTVRTRDFART
jgi:Ser/Thr protein kinase RdoA (MazF antagonist)